MPLRPTTAITQATELLLARRWEAGLRDAFDYRQLFHALLEQEKPEAGDEAAAQPVSEAPPYDQAATDASLEEFRQTLQQRAWTFAAEELIDGRTLEPWALGLMAGALPASSAAAADGEDALIQQWRLAQAESASGRRRKGLVQTAPSHQALSAYGGVTLLGTSKT